MLCLQQTIRTSLRKDACSSLLGASSSQWYHWVGTALGRWLTRLLTSLGGPKLCSREPDLLTHPVSTIVYLAASSQPCSTFSVLSSHPVSASPTHTDSSQPSSIPSHLYPCQGKGASWSLPRSRPDFKELSIYVIPDPPSFSIHLSIFLFLSLPS